MIQHHHLFLLQQLHLQILHHHHLHSYKLPHQIQIPPPCPIYFLMILSCNLPTHPFIHPPSPRVINTRSKNNISKPIQKLTLTTTIYSPPNIEPTSDSQALKHPRWRQALTKELDAITRLGTYSLLPLDPNHPPIGCKWVYRIKRLAMVLLIALKHD